MGARNYGGVCLGGWGRERRGCIQGLALGLAHGIVCAVGGQRGRLRAGGRRGVAAVRRGRREGLEEGSDGVDGRGLRAAAEAAGARRDGRE